MTADARPFEIARANRLLAAEMFESLTPEQLDAPTLCEGWTAPVIGAGGPLTDTAVHLRDVARPLGLDHDPPPEHWVPVLEFLCSRAAEKGFVPKGRARDLRIRPTDVDADLGDPSGLEVTGTAEALAMTLAGRVAAADEVAGPGAPMLRSRLGVV